MAATDEDAISFRDLTVSEATHRREHDAHDLTHASEHSHEEEETRLRESQLDLAIAAHAKEHAAAEMAVRTALASVEKLAVIHAEAHTREHSAHEQRHLDAAVAVAKAEASVDRRLEQMNEFRGQLRDQQATFVTIDRIDVMQAASDRRFSDVTKHTDDRYEENRRRIELLEKGDVKQEGKGLGQSAVVAIIVGAIGLFATVLSIIIILANIATGTGV